MGDSPTLKDVLDGPGLTFDDMASVGLSEVDLDAIGDEEADVETVKTEDDEIDLGALAQVHARPRPSSSSRTCSSSTP